MNFLTRLRGLQAPVALDEPLRLQDGFSGIVTGGGSGQTILVARDRAQRREPHRPPGGTPAPTSGAATSAGPTILIARNMRDVRRQANRAPGSPLVIPASGVTPGTYNTANITVGADGRVIAAASGTVLATALPGLIPDLRLWWESDDILGAAGSTVSQFRERTPWITGILGLQGPATGTPSAIVVSATPLNGLPILKWPIAAGSGLVTLSGDGFDLLNGATIFVVCIPGANTAALQCLIGGNTNSTALYLQGVASVPKLTLIKTGTAVMASSTASWTVGTAFQANVTYNPTTGLCTFRQGRAAAGSGGSTIGSGAGRTTFLAGDVGPSAPLNLTSVAAQIVYNRVLTSTEITNIENYLFAKWGV